MVKKTMVAVGLMALCCLTPARAAYKEVSLDGDWDFTFKASLTNDTPELPEPAAYDVQLRVPDYMNFQTERFCKAKWAKPGWKDTNFIEMRGMAFYRRFVDIPADWAGKSMQLHIGRAYDRINVWVNGKHVGFYPYITFNPLVTDLSAILKPGVRNEIIISVDNKTPLTYKFSVLGGIVAPVYLKVSNGPGRIDDLYLRPGQDLTEIVWQAELKIAQKGRTVEGSSLKWVVRNWQTEEIVGQGVMEADEVNDRQTISWRSRHPEIKSWHPDHPNLYIAELSWEKKGEVIDTLKRRFGLRHWGSEERTLKLNGKPIFLRQFYEGIDRATHWRYPQDKEYWFKYFRLIKERGYNGVDWLSIASPEALEAADEVGIAVQCGYLMDALEYLRKTLNMPNGSLDAPFLWADIARWTRSYPSMSIYVLGGEMAYYAAFIDDVAKCNTAIKAFNPESLLLPNQAMRGIEYTFAPEDKPHLKLTPSTHYPERLDKLTQCSDIFGNYPGGVFSYHPLNGNWRDINKWFAHYKRPLISHEVMQSNKLPYLLPKDGQASTLRYGKKGIENIIYRWGSWPTQKSAIDKRVAACSLDERTRLEYENMSRLSAILFKYVGEKMRKCDNLAGYQDICAHGGLNLFLEDYPGFTAEGFRRFNNDNVLLLDWDNGLCLKCCWWTGEPFEALTMASLYGEENIPQGKLSWELKDGEKILLQGASQAGDLPLGKVTTLAPIKFKWPEVAQNKKLNLALKLSGNGRTIRNDWNFWVFKKRPAPKVEAACVHNMYLLLKTKYPAIRYLKEETAGTKLWIVDLLDEDAVKHLEEGGDILLVGGKPLPLHTQWPKFEQGFRNHHNSGSIVHKHPVFKDIPNEGWGDWQFYPLLDGSAPVIFRNERTAAYGGSKPVVHPKQKLMKDVPFNPILEIVHNGRQADQASVFELKAGKGKLFVTTCVVDVENPVSATLFDSILEYTTGPQFNPAGEVKIETLKGFLEGAGPLISQNFVGLKLQNIDGGTFTTVYNCFGIAPKDAVFIFAGERAQTAFVLTAPQVPVTSEKKLVLSLEGQDCDKPGPTQVEISLNGHTVFKGTNQCVKMGWSTWNVPFEKDWLVADANILQFRNLEASAQSGNKWFALSGLTLKANDSFVRESAKFPSGEAIKNDREPPVVKLISNPPIEQRGHENIGTRHTIFELKCDDKGLGVKQIEISLDEEPYMPYTGAFILGTGESDQKKAGVRKLRIRCSDHAGNQTAILKGASEEGKDLDCMELQIK